MTRMVFCDLDGTLLPAGKKSIGKAVLTEIKRLLNKGVIFAVASGRSYDELKALFGELSGRIVFICLDGALAIHRDCVLYKNRLCKIEAGRLISLSPRAVAYGRTKSISFDENTNSALREQLLNTLGSEVFKVAVFDTPKKSSIARVCYNRDGICEYVNHSADKGAAARAIMQKFCVAAEDTVGIGDGENDLQLLTAVGRAYKMEKCHSALCDVKAETVGDIVGFLKNI